MNQQRPNCECMIVAALFGAPLDCAGYLERIMALPFNDVLLGKIALLAAGQVREGGMTLPEAIAEEITRSGKYSTRDVYDAIVDCMEYLVLVLDKHSVNLAVQYIEDRDKAEQQTKTIDLLSRQLQHGRIELKQARLVIDQLIEDNQSTSNGFATLNELMTTDPSEEPLDIINTGLQWFDNALPNGGFQRGDKVVFSSPPGVGKTAFALQLGLNILDHNKDARVLWCLGEMTERALRNRALQCASGLTMNVLHREWEDLSPTQHQAKRVAVDTLREIGKRFYFLPAPLTPETIEDAIIRTRADFVVVDYLQLVRCENDKGSRREEVDEVVREFMRIAQRHSPVLFLISDQGKGAESGRDIFSAFKESSEIAFAADLAFVAEVVDQVQPNGQLPEPVDIRMRCLKARHGKAQDINLQFSRDKQSFKGYMPDMAGAPPGLPA